MTVLKRQRAGFRATNRRTVHTADTVLPPEMPLLPNSATELTPFLAAGAQAPPSSPAAPPGARAVADIVVITTRDDFLLELGAVLGDQAAVHPVESVTVALEHLGASRRAHILVFDTRGMADLRNCVGRAYARAPDAVILLFAEAADEAGIRRAFQNSRVFAVLPLPIDQPRSALTFADALTGALANYRATPARIAAAHASATTTRTPSKDRWGVRAALAVLVFCAAVWFIASNNGPAASGALRSDASVSAVQRALAQSHVDDLLEKARTAMSERRYTQPPGDSALLYYRSAAAADSSNAEAIDGVARVIAMLSARFDEDLQQSHLEAAATTLAEVRSAAPNDPRTDALAARLTRAKAQADLAGREEPAQRKNPASVAAKPARAKSQLPSPARTGNATPQVASSPPSAADHPTLPQAELKLTHYVAPEYPDAALTGNVGGSVVVAYTVNALGATRDVRVVSAEPAGIFDRSAIDAVQRWRYAPVLIENTAVAVPTRTSIRFTPQ